MATEKAKTFVLNGVGEAYVSKIVNGRNQVTQLGTLQDLKISFSASEEEVFGGDSPTPIYIISKDQKINISAQEARFSLEYLSLTNGAKVNNKGLLNFATTPELIATGTAYTVKPSLTSIVPESVYVTIADDKDMSINATHLAQVSGTPKTGEFKITPAGVITLGDSVTNKYIKVTGQYTDTKSRTATVSTASVPSYVEIRHTSQWVDLGNGKEVRIHTTIPKARATGKLDVDHKRQAAHAPQLEFSAIYDTNRDDGKIIIMTEEVRDKVEDEED